MALTSPLPLPGWLNPPPSPSPRPTKVLLLALCLLVLPSTALAGLSVITPAPRVNDLTNDSSGDLVAATTVGTVVRITPAGVVTVLASVPSVIAVATDASDNVFALGQANDEVIKITPGGVATVILDATGDGSTPFSAASGSGVVATDASGNVFVSGDRHDELVFKITPAGVVSLILHATGDGTNPINDILHMTTDPSGNVFAISRLTRRVFKVTPAGVVSVVLGPTGDGTTPVTNPRYLATDSLGNLFVSVVTPLSVFKVTPTGVITRILDGSGDGTNVAQAAPSYLAAAPNGDLYTATASDEQGFKITPAGVVTQYIDETGDGTTILSSESGLTATPDGSIYLSSTTALGASSIFRHTDAVCGDSIVEGAELCDGGSCCTATCTFEPATTECRGTAGVCDIAEFCDGASAVCPTDDLQTAGTVCRLSIDPECDPEELCDGASASCGADVQDPDGGSCDDTDAGTVGETCTSGLCGCLGTDLDGDLIADVCDPNDGNITYVRKVVVKPTRSKLGSIKATRGTFQSPAPLDASQGFTFSFADSLGMLESVTVSGSDCTTSSSGKIKCKVGIALAAKITPNKKVPGEYRYNIKLRDLDFEAPLAGPLTMSITEEATNLDFVRTLTACTVTSSTMRCQ